MFYFSSIKFATTEARGVYAPRVTHRGSDVCVGDVDVCVDDPSGGIFFVGSVTGSSEYC